MIFIFQYFINSHFVSLSAERSVIQLGIGWFSSKQTLLLHLTGAFFLRVCLEIWYLQSVCSLFCEIKQ